MPFHDSLPQPHPRITAQPSFRDDTTLRPDRAARRHGRDESPRHPRSREFPPPRPPADCWSVPGWEDWRRDDNESSRRPDSRSFPAHLLSLSPVNVQWFDAHLPFHWCDRVRSHGKKPWDPNRRGEHYIFPMALFAHRWATADTRIDACHRGPGIGRRRRTRLSSAVRTLGPVQRTVCGITDKDPRLYGGHE